MIGLRDAAHALLRRAGLYDLSQRLLRRDAAPLELVHDLLRPASKARILDLGCGTARLLEQLPPTVDYLGCDAEGSYVEAARARHGHRARFRELTVERLSELGEGDFDLIVAKGLIHHLDDTVAANLYRTARGLLRPGGNMVTLDPVRTPGQHLATRALFAMDRGRYIRTGPDYLRLLGTDWEVIERRIVEGRLRLPYSHFFVRAAPAL